MPDKEMETDKLPLKNHYGNYMLPIRDALELFSGKWKIPIITALSFYGSCGFKELEGIVEGITPRMLSKELKFLEENKIISRETDTKRPGSIVYSITEYGKTCSTVMSALYHWGVEHRRQFFNQEEERTWEQC